MTRPPTRAASHLPEQQKHEQNRDDDSHDHSGVDGHHAVHVPQGITRSAHLGLSVRMFKVYEAQLGRPGRRYARLVNL
jgi:hypothetical protein